MNIDKCKSCGARVIWARTQNNKAMPLDYEPCADGNVELLPSGDCIVMGPSARLYIEGPLHKSHFATCEFAKKHRKKPQPKGA